MRPFVDSYLNTAGPAQFAPAFPDYVKDVVLASSVAVNLPVPAGARFAVFSFDGDVRVRLGTQSGSIIWPTETSASGMGSKLNPTARRLPLPANDEMAPTHICLLSGSGCAGSVSYYA